MCKREKVCFKRNVVVVNGEIFAIDPGLVLASPTIEEAAQLGKKENEKNQRDINDLPF